MHPILVVGSIAFDSIETPVGRVENELGGSATHFSCAASYFAPVRLVGVVGHDFPPSFLHLFDERKVDTEGLHVADGHTFRWTGRYQGAMNHAETISVALNVFGEYEPKIPAKFRDSPFVFLANGSPTTQRAVFEQLTRPKFVVLDTMNLWIHTQRDALLEMVSRVDCLVLNEDEAKDLTEQHNLVSAGRRVQELGPSTVVLKKGQHGSLLFHQDHVYPVPALPLSAVVDPTGAGDTFAGGFVGALARAGEISIESMRSSMLYATVMASFNVEAFGLRRVRELDLRAIDERHQAFVELLTPTAAMRSLV